MVLTRQLRFLFALLAVVLGAAGLYAQGVTTSSMAGQVTDAATGETLIGANVSALHVPTGTLYGNSTDVDGFYRIPGMRVGGPYDITVTYTGYGEQKIEGVYLRLGESRQFSFELADAATELMTIEVIGQVGTAGENAGASTQITSFEIDAMPTLNRDLTDFVRLTPQASSFGSGTSFAGVNNRYNAIYIDGAVNNDVFGLSSSGTNGGQTGISPFSIDIIDQFQVVLSPYDVTLGGFAGGGINAVTKSGTNSFEGTAYYFFQNENLAGKTNGVLADRLGDTFEPTKLDEFTQKTYGVSLGGPIVKDKVFFFVNAEIQDDETPSPFEFGTYTGNASESDLNNLRSFVRDEYGYDPGTFGNVSDQLEGLKLFGKLDINLSDDHRLTLRHSYTNAEQFSRNAGFNRRINFSNNGVFFPTTTNSSALELNSTFGNRASNNLIIGFTSVRDDRDPLAGDFPYVIIEDGANEVIQFGSEQFSTANNLEQDIFTITNNFKLYRGRHTLTFGTHNEFYSIYNLFIRQNYGVYRFANLDDFLTGAPAFEYDRSYSLVDNITGDGSAAAAEFNAMQLGFYAQDEFAISNKLTVTGGLRIDLPIITSDPTGNEGFNRETLPALAAEYEVARNVEAGVAPDGQLMFSPRLGFTYNLLDANNSTIRGGIGIFTSRIPFVWPGAMFQNNGAKIASMNERDIDGDINFIPGISNQYTDPEAQVPSGQVDLFTKDFKYPQVLRGNLGFDTRLPGGFQATIEGIYTKTLNNVVYTNINSDPTVDFTWTGSPDNRPVYTRTDIDPTYFAIYAGSNTSEGYTYTLTASLAKKFSTKLNATLAYTYGDAEAVNEGTSSQNSSQWRGQVNIDGRNSPVLGRSDYAMGHRVISSINYKLAWTEDETVATTFSLFFNGQSGNPYSYVIGGGRGRNPNNETGSSSRNRSLIYIPATQNDINLIDIDGGLSASEQWANLNAFIEDDPYLSANRGGYASKNGAWAPFAGIFDFALRQDLGVRAGGKTHKLQFSFDVFNFANLLNSDWGTVYTVPGDFNNYFLYSFQGYAADGTTPQFTYTGEADRKESFNIAGVASRWRARLGVRYIFN